MYFILVPQISTTVLPFACFSSYIPTLWRLYACDISIGSIWHSHLHPFPVTLLFLPCFLFIFVVTGYSCHVVYLICPWWINRCDFYTLRAQWLLCILRRQIYVKNADLLVFIYYPIFYTSSRGGASLPEGKMLDWRRTVVKASNKASLAEQHLILQPSAHYDHCKVGVPNK